MDYSSSIFQSCVSFYQSLCDEESRFLYRAAFVWRMLGLEQFYKCVEEYDYHKDYGWNELDDYEFFKEDRSGRIVLFGSGSNGMELYYQLKAMAYNVVAFCDNDSGKIGTKYCGLTVISAEQLKNDYTDAFVIIMVSNKDIKEKIYKQVSGLGFGREKICLPVTGFACIYNLDKKQYFDSAIFTPGENEIYIDAGAFDGQTVIQFAEWCGGKYEKIYALEPSKEMAEKCSDTIRQKALENVEILCGGAYSENTELYLDNSLCGSGAASISDSGRDAIKCYSIDSLLKGGPATYIKMDIEGSELAALKGANNTIMKYKPKLAVCLYHKQEDLVAIPAYIRALRDDYKFYIRKYTPHHGEIVLYGI